MFRWKRAKPIELIPFATATPLTFTPLLCDGVTAHHLPSFAELLALHAQLQRERPDCTVLASLDDLGQACYTSGHCIDTHGLDDIEGHDLSGLDAVLEDGEHPGYLTTPAEFPIRLANLLQRARTVDFAQVAGVLDWETTDDANDLLTINTAPEPTLRIVKEREILFQFVPVASAADAIAAFPNGYFNADLTPMQNHALVRHLEVRYGLALFGIGSRYLGLRRKEALDAQTARALAVELAGLYASAPDGAADALATVITGRDWLLLRYTES